jgi:hypothetical protein
MKKITFIATLFLFVAVASYAQTVQGNTATPATFPTVNSQIVTPQNQSVKPADTQNSGTVQNSAPSGQNNSTMKLVTGTAVSTNAASQQNTTKTGTESKVQMMKNPSQTIQNVSQPVSTTPQPK